MPDGHMILSTTPVDRCRRDLDIPVFSSHTTPAFRLALYEIDFLMHLQ